MKVLIAVALAAAVLSAACGSDSSTRSSNTTPKATIASQGVKPASSPPGPTSAAAPPTSAASPTPAKAAPTSVPASQSDGNAPGIPALTGNIQSLGNLRYIDEKVGDGATPQNGQHVTVHYTGWLTDGTKFDSSVDRNQPFQFVLGGRVIPGWNQGVATMKVGGKRRLIIPPELGYGAQGSPPRIPPNATLIFDVELLSIQP